MSAKKFLNKHGYRYSQGIWYDKSGKVIDLERVLENFYNEKLKQDLPSEEWIQATANNEAWHHFSFNKTHINIDIFIEGANCVIDYLREKPN